MKKIIILSIIVVASIVGVFSIPKEQKSIISSTSNETQNSELEMEEVKDVESVGKIEITQEKPEETKKAELVVSKEKNEQPKEVDDSFVDVKKENKTQSSTNSEKKIDVKEQETHQEKKDIQEEIEKPKIVEEKKSSEEDIEYQNLMKQVEYSTYDECMKAGFDIAFSDTVNILGFDPVEIIYKGQILGYKLKIHYTNPMEN